MAKAKRLRLTSLGPTSLWLIGLLSAALATPALAASAAQAGSIAATSSTTQNTPVTLPDKAALALSQQWRARLLQGGGAGLYQALDLDLLGKKAGLNRLDRSLLPRLQGWFAGETPLRVRVYWVASAQAWVARLDFADAGVNFLRLQIEGGKLIDWYDYSLGTSLSQLLAAAASRPPSQLSAYLDALEQNPMAALTLVDAHTALARLAVAACLSHDCYEDALAKLPSAPNETSLFALEKAIAAGDFSRADAQMRQLQQALGDDPAVVWLAAGLLMSEKNWQQTLAAVLPALTRWPSEPRLYPLASQCYMELQQPEQALAVLQTMEQKTGTRIDWQQLVQTPLYAPLQAKLQQQGLLP